MYLLTYLTEPWMSPGCSYEFNVVYVQRENHNIFYTTATYEINTVKNKNKIKIIKKHFGLSFSLLYLCIRSCKFERENDENVTSSLIIQSFKVYNRVRSKAATRVLCWSLLLIKNFKVTFSKRGYNASVFLWILQTF